MLNINSLNDKQKLAVETITGPVLVLAGAGSGKTRVLTYRIAHLIENNNIPPENILAFTFTNKAASEMKERIANLVKNSKNIWLGTFHSICVKLLRRHAAIIGFSNSFSIYDSSDQKQIIKDIIKSLNIDEKFLNTATVISKISKLKNEFITPKEYLNYCEQHSNNEIDEKIANIYREYQISLFNANAMDFDDLIFNTIKLFLLNEDLLKYYHNIFQYILIDEYQDTNKLQYQLIKLLINENKNICVVGDNDQSIYAWRGANVKNILNFENDFKNAKVILLEQNYRSTKNILNLANSVIKNNKQYFEKKLWSDKSAGSLIEYNICDNDREETNLVVEKIKYLIYKNYSYNDCAILYRTNSQSGILELELKKYGIPCKVVGSLKFFQREEIKDLISHLILFENKNEITAFKRIINKPKRKIGAKAIENFLNIYYNLNDKNLNILETIKYALDNNLLNTSNKGFKEFYDIFNSFECSNPDFIASQFLNHVIEKIDFIEYIKNNFPDNSDDRIENIKELISQIINFETLYKNNELDIENYDNSIITSYLENIAIASNDDEVDNDDCVKLMTIHTSKGLEFKNVFLVGFADGLFPSFKSNENTEELEEERRLCYVAITRAMENLFISYPKSRFSFGQTFSYAPSKFISEMDKTLLTINSKNKNNYSNLNSPKGTFSLSNYDNYYKYNNEKRNYDDYDLDIFSLKINKELTIPESLKSKEQKIQKPKLDLNIGDIVEHKFFGKGTILDIKDEQHGDEIVINFEKKGEKILSYSNSTLKKI